MWGNCLILLQICPTNLLAFRTLLADLRYSEYAPICSKSELVGVGTVGKHMHIIDPYCRATRQYVGQLYTNNVDGTAVKHTF
jgi:hypothetical protein